MTPGLPVSWLQLALCGGALVVVYAWLQALHRTGRAEGTITGITTRPGPDRDETTVPVITFAVGGTRYSFQPGLVLPGEAKRARVGSKVLVAYNPDHPEDAEVAVAYRRYLGPVVVTVLYGAFVYWLVASSLSSAVTR